MIGSAVWGSAAVGISASIRGHDFRERAIASKIKNRVGPGCVDGKVVNDDTGVPRCKVVDRLFSNGVTSDVNVAACATNGGVPPCWKLASGAQCSAGAYQLTVDRGGVTPSPTLRVLASCEICTPGSLALGCN